MNELRKTHQTSIFEGLSVTYVALHYPFGFRANLSVSTRKGNLQFFFNQ